MGTTIALIILSVGLIIVAFCNFMVNYYQTSFQEKLNKRVSELEWQNQRIEKEMTILQKEIFNQYYKEDK